jgi:hypothetical protein
MLRLLAPLVLLTCLSVAFAQAPAPLTAPLPGAGEISRMGADRVWSNAWLESHMKAYRYGFVTSKADYAPFLRAQLEPRLKAEARQMIASGRALPEQDKGQELMSYPYAFYCLAMHDLTQDPEYIALARELMDQALDVVGYGWGGFRLNAVLLYRNLTWKQDPRSPWAPPDAEQRFRAAMAATAARPPVESLFGEWGTHNRTWSRYMMLKVARAVAEEDGKPVDPRVVEYTDYHDKLVGWTGDSDDASANYHWVFLDAALGWYLYTQDWEEFKRNNFPQTVLRYVDMVAPSGACPQFAASSGWHEVGMGMWLLELVSTATRDGRFRWAAQRMAEYYYNHFAERPLQSWGIYYGVLDNFAMAYVLADDTVEPVPYSPQSRVTWRHPFVPTAPEVLAAHPGKVAPESMDPYTWLPDKVVLSSGNDPNGLWGLLELVPKAGHGGEIPGNFIALLRYGSALLSGQGYYEKTPDLQNLLWINEENLKTARTGALLDTQVPIFVEDPAYTFVRVRTTNFQRLPVTYTRDLLFVKNGFVLVRDRARFEAALENVSLGPCWQTRDLGPQCGENWFNTYYSKLNYGSAGLGKDVHTYRNPAWDLLIYFTPRPDRTQTVLDRYDENPFRNSPIQLRQVWTGDVEAGQEIVFTTVLLPHAPVFKPRELLEPAQPDAPRYLEVLADTDRLAAVRVWCDLNPLSGIRNQICVMLNDTGDYAEAGPIATDALVAVVVHGAQGTVEHRGVAGGRLLQYLGKDESPEARRSALAPLAKPAELQEWEKRYEGAGR